MPVPIAAKVGVIAVSVAVAAAVAIYESPELQRAANDLRRRIAIALHAFGDSITPQERENLFNRPEDAEGFLQSRYHGSRDAPGVEADAESLRRQREELMYWNSLRESRENEKDHRYENEKMPRSRASTRSSNFDDFLKQDKNAEKGAFVFQTGHEPLNNEGLIRRRGADGPRSVNHSIYTDPFADEHGIEDDIAFENSLVDPTKDEMSDIYSATDLGAYQPSRTMSLEQNAATPIFPKLADIADVTVAASQPRAPSQQSLPPQPAPVFSEPELGADEYMTAGQERGDDVYGSIQAWAHGASYDASFYSPLPVSPATASEAEFLTDGELTPTDSASLAGSGIDVADEVGSTKSFDIMSDDSGMDTPTSWTDVESAAGESESGAMHA
ncbi:hypothetical protein SAMD00023353_1800740 [Rosellinia necatrix]|uniref:Uncharacterized protein n=1 Tax=Rosellinia necatrix TaxID=77044 RepID=A0A1W2TE99_ROSNE|nr:hypothetical protein SAMD00023353_1800740 [Rosellinia necatrix]